MSLVTPIKIHLVIVLHSVILCLELLQVRPFQLQLFLEEGRFSISNSTGESLHHGKGVDR